MKILLTPCSDIDEGVKSHPGDRGRPIQELLFFTGIQMSVTLAYLALTDHQLQMALCFRDGPCDSCVTLVHVPDALAWWRRGCFA